MHDDDVWLQLLPLHVCQNLQGLMLLGSFHKHACVWQHESDNRWIPILVPASLREASKALGLPSQHALMAALQNDDTWAPIFETASLPEALKSPANGTSSGRAVLPEPTYVGDSVWILPEASSLHALEIPS